MKKLKSYNVPVEWVSYGTVRVQAYSPRHAFNIVHNNEHCLDIPDDEAPGDIRTCTDLPTIKRSEGPAESDKIGFIDEWILIDPEGVVEVREDD